jgi:hypothetical protein
MFELSRKRFFLGECCNKMNTSLPYAHPMRLFLFICAFGVLFMTM